MRQGATPAPCSLSTLISSSISMMHVAIRRVTVLIRKVADELDTQRAAR